MFTAGVTMRSINRFILRSNYATFRPDNVIASSCNATFILETVLNQAGRWEPGRSTSCDRIRSRGYPRAGRAGEALAPGRHSSLPAGLSRARRDDHHRASPHAHLGRLRAYGNLRPARGRRAGREGDRCHRRLGEGPAAGLGARGEVGIQQLGLHAAGRHHRAGIGTALRRVPAAGLLRPSRDAPHVLRGPAPRHSRESDWLRSATRRPAQLGQPIAEPVPVRTPVSTLEGLVGTYRGSDVGACTMAVEGDSLVAQIPGLGTMKLVPVGPGVFRTSVVTWTFSFETDARGRGTRVRIRDWKLNDVAERVLPAATAPRPIVGVSATDLEACVGEYEALNGILVSVERAGDHLSVQPFAQEVVEVFPVSTIGFITKSGDVEYRFVKDSSGRVTGYLRSSGGRRVPARHLSHKASDPLLVPQGSDGTGDDGRAFCASLTGLNVEPRGRPGGAWSGPVSRLRGQACCS